MHKVHEQIPLGNQRVIHINLQRNNNINNIDNLDGNEVDVESALNQ